MSERELSERMTFMERKLQRIRLAIIVIAAFFIYQAIGPLTFGGERVEAWDVVKVGELLVVDELGKVVAYLNAGEDGAELVLNDAAGNRVVATGAGIVLTAPEDGNRVERLRIPE